MADVLTLWSATADFSAAVPDFHGVFDRGVWDAQSQDATKFYGTAGTYLQTGTGADYDYLGVGFSDLTVTSTAGVEEGMYVYIAFSGVNNDGYFRVAQVTDATTLVVNATALESVGTSIADDANVTYYIGGVSDALDSGVTLQAELDAAGTDYATGDHDVTILGHSTEDVPTTIQIDFTPTGSTTTDVVLTATNASFVEDGSKIRLVLTSAIAVSSVIEITTDYVTLRHVKVVGNGGSSTPTYGIQGTSSALGITLFDCQITGYSAWGINFRGAGGKGSMCTVSGGAFGFNLSGDACAFNNCTSIGSSTGFRVNNQGGSLVGCVAINASVLGLYVDRNSSIVSFNAWNCLDGVYVASGVARPVIVENSSLTCTDDAFTGAANASLHSINNHTDAGGSVTDGIINLVSNIDPLTGDPKFNNIIEVTDLACATGTTKVVTSATLGFTSAMEGKELLIASGTNFAGGAYIIETYTNATTVTLAEQPKISTGSAASAGIGGYYDFRLQTDSSLRGAGNGAFNNIGAYDDTDTPEIASILPPDTFNDVVGTGSGGGGGGAANLFTGLLS